MKIINLIHGKSTMVDDEDYELLTTQRCKVILRSSITGTYHAQFKGVRLHRYLMNLTKDDKCLVDHIDGNPLNNQKSNLRICNNSENSRNSKKAKNNTSGYKGVFFENDNKKKRYKVCISINNKRKHVGRYETANEAAIAYNDAAIKYYGEFARLNELR